MADGYIYLIRVKDSYKLGSTHRDLQRIREYESPTLLCIQLTPNYEKVESILIDIFRSRFRLTQGREFFQASPLEVNDMIDLINEHTRNARIGRQTATMSSLGRIIDTAIDEYDSYTANSLIKQLPTLTTQEIANLIPRVIERHKYGYRIKLARSTVYSAILTSTLQAYDYLIPTKQEARNSLHLADLAAVDDYIRANWAHGDPVIFGCIVTWISGLFRFGNDNPVLVVDSSDPLIDALAACCDASQASDQQWDNRLLIIRDSGNPLSYPEFQTSIGTLKRYTHIIMIGNPAPGNYKKFNIKITPGILPKFGKQDLINHFLYSEVYDSKMYNILCS